MGVEATEEALLQASTQGDAAVVRELLAKGVNPNAKDDYFKWSALELTARGGHQEAMLDLLKAGADVHARGVCGRTPLHAAAETGQIEAMKTLVANGGDVAIKDESGDSPLHSAAMGGQAAALKTLVELGAYVDS